MPVSRGIPGHCSLGDYFKARWTALSSFVGREKNRRGEKKEEDRKVKEKKRGTGRHAPVELSRRGTRNTNKTLGGLGPSARPATR